MRGKLINWYIVDYKKKKGLDFIKNAISTILASEMLRYLFLILHSCIRKFLIGLPLSYLFKCGFKYTVANILRKIKTESDGNHWQKKHDVKLTTNFKPNLENLLLYHRFRPSQ